MNYNLSKTIKFSLLETENSKFEDIAKIIEEDKLRRESYQNIIKPMADDVHRNFIDSCLNKIHIDFNIFFEEYMIYEAIKDKKDRNNKSKDIEKLMSEFRRIISNQFTKNDIYEKLFDKKLFFEEVLPQYINEFNLENKPAIVEVLKSFKGFTMYIEKFMKSRANFYSDENKSTAIANRIINENLILFIKNTINLRKIKDTYPDLAETIIKAGFNYELNDYNKLFTQKYIDEYNDKIGGVVEDKEITFLGINQIINEYKQNKAKQLKADISSKAKIKVNIPNMKRLNKQILGISKRGSYMPENFKSDEELMLNINNFYEKFSSYNLNGQSESIITHLKKLFEKLLISNEIENLYISNLSLNAISQFLFADWALIKIAMLDYAEKIKTNDKGKKMTAKQIESWQESKFFQVSEIEDCLQFYIKKLANDNPLFIQYGKQNQIILNYFQLLKFSTKNGTTFSEVNIENDIKEKFAAFKEIEQQQKISLAQNEKAKEVIKIFLDSVKTLQNHLKPLVLEKSKKPIEDIEKNEFYTDFELLYDQIREIVPLYMKAQSWLSKVPYNTEKIKLNFENSTLLSGWSSDFKNKGAFIYKDLNNYYLVIQYKSLSKDEVKNLKKTDKTETVDWVKYNFQKPDFKNIPRLFIRSKKENFAPAVSKYNLPIQDIIEIYDNKKYTPAYKKTDETEFKKSLIKLIDYFKIGFQRHESYKHFNFKWKDSALYNNIAEFYTDTEKSCYYLELIKMNKKAIADLASEKKLLVYKIYSKDFSEKSTGNKNLHTLYWQMLFHPEYLKKTIYKLSGGGEIFFRETNDVSSNPTHPKNTKIARKNYFNKETNLYETISDEITNELNKYYNNKIAESELSLDAKKYIDNYSLFSHDITKDLRYKKNHMQAHFSIILNYQYPSMDEYTFNEQVQKQLRQNSNTKIIGIDRGERHLAYYSVIDTHGNIIEQNSFNTINHVDYHKKLESLEKSRNEGRKNWQTINNIKNLKNGYISFVVNEIAKLMIKHNAIIVFEELNQGFKRSRMKFEKQIYQKLEKALIDKLNYLVTNKSLENLNENGSLINAYQFTPQVNSLTDFGKQCGKLFYVRADYTSKVDPSTGYINFINFRYTNMNDAKQLIQKFHSMKWNEQENYFEIKIDYSNIFPDKNTGTKTDWILCTHGNKRYSYNGKEMMKVDVNQNLIKLLKSYSIDIHKENIINEILNIKEPKFWETLLFNLKVLTALRYSNKSTNEDYILSPVKNKGNSFFDTSKTKNHLPKDADANGAYNIARKGILILQKIENKNQDISITNDDWFKFIQTNPQNI